jgi:PPOX class probable F420-dependent enzyme
MVKRLSLEEKIKKYHSILTKKSFAHLATINNDGSPQSTPVWFDLEDGYLRINTAVGRKKEKNMNRDPRVAMSILDPENPYFMVSIQGKVVERTIEGADSHIDSLARKYLGVEKYPYRNPKEIRIVYKIKPISVSGTK